MNWNRFKASVAVCVICGCALAGGLLASGTAPDKAIIGGLLVAVGGMAVAGLVYFVWAGRQTR